MTWQIMDQTSLTTQAQRAIRERTRAQIDRLNDRISELENANHYQEKQGAIQQRDAIQNENDELKRKIAQVVGLLQPILGNSHKLDGMESKYIANC
jgi:FtsZ-binding cell division protein ZapB